MVTEIKTKFENYSWFSIQVDQYYSAVMIYSRYHEHFKDVFNSIPDNSKWNNTDNSNLNEDFKELILVTTRIFKNIGTTGIFQDAPFPELEDLPNDMINFGFYTCFCFQWTLFENYVKETLLDQANKKFFSTEVFSKLKSKYLRTESFLKYINSGQVFGYSPFQTGLPIKGWVFKTEEYDYNDLNKIRNLRNSFIHAVPGREILNKTEIEKEQLYNRSMWILRQFAGNIYQAILKIHNEKQ